MKPFVAQSCTIKLSRVVKKLMSSLEEEIKKGGGIKLNIIAVSCLFFLK